MICRLKTTLVAVNHLNLNALALFSFTVAATSACFADDLQQKNSGGFVNHALYEAITGESADDDRSAWDSFYKSRSNAFGKDAIDFLKQHLSKIPRGRAFVPAMGEGRNALFLAKNGFSVEGVDISQVAVQKALADAKALKVNIKATVEDLTQYRYPENYFDLIVVSLYYDKSLIPKFKQSLKKGGYILFYNKLAAAQLKGTHGIAPDDFTVKSGELKEDFKDYQIKDYREFKDRGSSIAAILAKKI